MGSSFDNSSVTQLCQEGPKTTDTMAAILMVAGVVAIGVLLTISIRGKIARRNADRPTGRELIDQVKSRAHTGAGQDVAEQTAEMVNTARRLAAQLDNKAKRLEILIGEADRRIEALGGSATAAPVERTPESPKARKTAEPPPRPEPEDPAPEPPADPLTRAVYELADRGRNAIDIARELDEQVGKIELILALRAA
jgi:hypothetical protein